MRYFLTILLSLIPASATALNVSGRITASAHSWERQESDGSSSALSTFHQILSLQARDLGVKGLSFHAYARGFIHTEGPATRRRLALYNTYADWKSIAHRLDLRLGRQRIFAGVGRGTFDGARAKVALTRSISLLAYAGTGAPTDYSTAVVRWNNAHMYGLRASARKWKSTLSISFASESRRRRNRRSGPDGEPVALSALARRLVGAEVRSRRFGRAEVYGRVDVDAVNRKTVRAQARIWGNLSRKLRMSGELDYKRPALASNSFLSVFNSKSNTDLEATMVYAIRGGVLISGAYAAVHYDDDRTQRFRASLSRGAWSVSYYRRLGYGGDRDGLTVGGRREIASGVSLRGNFNFSTYKLSALADNRDDTLAGVLGVDYTAAGKLAATVEGEILRNKTYDYDLRFFGKLTWWFSVAR